MGIKKITTILSNMYPSIHCLILF